MEDKLEIPRLGWGTFARLRVFLYDGLVNDFEVIPESDLSCVNSHGKDNYASANYMLVLRALSLLQV